MGENMLSVLIYELDISVLCDANFREAVFSFAMTIYTLKEYKCITDVTMGSFERYV